MGNIPTSMDQEAACEQSTVRFAHKEAVSKINIQVTPYKLVQLVVILSIINIVRCALTYKYALCAFLS